MTSNPTIDPPNEDFLRRLTQTLEGVRIGDAMSGLVSALMMVVLSASQDEKVQEGMIGALTETMRTKLREARIVATTGHLPN